MIAIILLVLISDSDSDSDWMINKPRSTWNTNPNFMYNVSGMNIPQEDSAKTITISAEPCMIDLCLNTKLRIKCH